MSNEQYIDAGYIQRLIEDAPQGLYGVRVTYRGFNTMRVETNVYRTTRLNLIGCMIALAILEGRGLFEVSAFKPDRDALKIDYYQTR
jgi:hypothetical protein